MNSNKMIIAIATFLTSILFGIIACVVWLVPISGIIFYPFISGVALILSLVSFFFAKESTALRIAAIVLSVILVIGIIGDIAVIISLMLEMFQ